MAADYPGGTFALDLQSTAEDVGDAIHADGADWNKHEENLKAILDDLRLAFAKLADVGATDMELALRAIVPVWASFLAQGLTHDVGTSDVPLRVGASDDIHNPLVSVVSSEGISATFADVNPDTITRAAGSFVTDGWESGMYVEVQNSASNDGEPRKVATVAATVLTLDGAETLTNEGPTAGVDLFANAFKIGADGVGKYDLTYLINYFNPVANWILTPSAYKNGAIVGGTTLDSRLTGLTDRGVIALPPQIIDLVLNDWIDLRAHGDSAQAGVTLSRVALNLRRIVRI